MSKDAVGKILQYKDWLSLGNSEGHISLEEFVIGGVEDYYYAGYVGDVNTSISLESKWRIKKFADKLKDIVCMLIGCTRKQLEDRAFKEKELSSEWWYYKLSIHNGAGGMFHELKDYLIYKDLYTESYIEKMKKEECYVSLVKTTPRLLLQLLGTDCGRNILHPNIWINALFADYKKDQSDWIITDVRFPNEAEAIKARGGIVVRVDRPCKECGGMGYHKMDCNIGRIEHESEYALDSYNFDYKLENDGSIRDLYKKVIEII